MDLSNINLNPVPDPLIPPVPPPINPDVMQAINTASIGGSPIPSFGVNGQVLPSSDESLNLAGQHTGSPVIDENDGALYEKYKHVADACRFTSIPEDSVWGADVPTCPLPTAPPSAVPDLSGIKIPDFTQQPMPVVEHQTKLTDFIDPNDEVIDPVVPTASNSKILADTLPDGQPNAVSGAFPSVNAMRPVPSPRPITGIPGYGEKGKLPVEPKPGSLHSVSMDREDALAASLAAQQSKGHVAVEQAFQRDLEQGKQGQKRYPHAQQVLGAELREIAKQVPKERKRTQSKNQSYVMPSEQSKDTIAEAMMRLHAHLMTHLSYKQRQNLYAIYRDQHSECPVKVRLLCENDFWPYANYIESEEPIKQEDIGLIWNATDL